MSTNSTHEAQHSSASTDLVLKPRDLEILSAVHEHRFLTTDLIWRLTRDGGPGSPDNAIGNEGIDRPKSYVFGLKSLYKRLALLHREEFLARHYVTDQPYGASYGSPRAVYGLGPKAVPPIADLTGFSTAQVRRMVEANEVKSPYLRHAIELSSFHITLILACQQSQEQIKLAFWQQGPRLHHDSSQTNQPSIYPDAIFGLSVNNKRTLVYMLEIDRGTMPIVATGNRTDLRKKFTTYKRYSDTLRSVRKDNRRTRTDRSLIVAGESYEQRGDRVFDPSPIPINGFRALFVVPGRYDADGSPHGRLKGILWALRSLGKEYATATLFWFAPADAINIDIPSSVFEPIWTLPNPLKPRQSLIQHY